MSFSHSASSAALERVLNSAGLLSMFTSPPGGVRSNAMSVSVCLSVRSGISKTRNKCELHVQTSRNFHYMLSVAVAMARSSSDDSAIWYALPVLWMTSFLPIKGADEWKTTKAIARHAHNLALARRFTIIHQVAAPCCSNRGRSLLLPIALFIFVLTMFDMSYVNSYALCK